VGRLVMRRALCHAVWLWLRGGRRGARAVDGPNRAAAPPFLLTPPAFFLSAPYSDSLGLALSLASLSCGLDGRFGAAGAFGFLSALTRPTGVLLAPALWIQWWQARRQNPSSTSSSAGWGWVAGGLPLPGIAAFLAYCGKAFGDPLAPFHR